jgi:hypothetical protein
MSSSASGGASAAPLRFYVHSVPTPHYPAWPEVTLAVNVTTGDTSPSLRRLKQMFKVRTQQADSGELMDCRGSRRRQRRSLH